MAPIEHLERDHCKEFFSEVFGYAPWTPRQDRSRRVGSSADDLRSWLVGGGIPRIRHNLEYSMDMRRFPEDRPIEVRDYIHKLLNDHRPELVGLARDEIIPISAAPDADGLSARDFEDTLRRIAVGERPFEEWMYAHRHTHDEVLEVYKSIDKWPVENGTLPNPGPLPRLH